MSFPTDLEIARQATAKPLPEIAAMMGIGEHLLEPYGRELAKISLDAIDELADRPTAKYVVVTAITPTPLGEGKTTTTVGLGQAMKHIGKNAVISLRQPSMGPTFGIKGGAAGGGYSQVIPMELLNLHLTGDFHAVTAAHNLLSAMIDNHLHHGNELGLDLDNITWRRVLDVNDRSLRNIVIGLGGKEDGVTRQTGFDITAASEVMAILALSNSMDDLRSRLGRIVVGYTKAGEPVTAEQLHGAGSMAVIMRDALKPNLLQTIENTPVIVHAGPFGNIAHGNSSVVGDLIGIHTGDYLITEAGFGADMGAERFFNIKCRASGLTPDAAVLVATVRALKAHSGKYQIVAGKPLPDGPARREPRRRARRRRQPRQADRERQGSRRHAGRGDQRLPDRPRLRARGDPPGRRGGRCAGGDVHALRDGGAGATDLARAVVEACEEPSGFHFLYKDTDTLKQKIEKVATMIYGAERVEYTPGANKQLKNYEDNGFGNLPVCIAKTHLSISGDASLKGAPTGHTLTVREARASVGAGFVYPICGEMRTMPGLGTAPAAAIIDFDENGEIVGLS